MIGQVGFRIGKEWPVCEGSASQISGFELETMYGGGFSWNGENRQRRRENPAMGSVKKKWVRFAEKREARKGSGWV